MTMTTITTAFRTGVRWSITIACFVAGIIAATLLIVFSIMAMWFVAGYADTMSAWLSIPTAFIGLFAPYLWFAFSLAMLVWLGNRLRYRLQFCGWMLGMTIAAAVFMTLLYGSMINAIFIGAVVSLAVLFLKRAIVKSYAAGFFRHPA